MLSGNIHGPATPLRDRQIEDLAPALHSETVNCMLPADLELKMNVPEPDFAKSALVLYRLGSSAI